MKALRRRITDILNLYGNERGSFVDLEVAHTQEDDLLWEYVREQASTGDETAKQLLRIAQSERIRWYA